MDRPIQPLLMVAGCAVLVVAAIALPVAILQPEGHVAPLKEVSLQQAPTAEIPVQQAPVAQAPAAQAPVAKAPAKRKPVAKAPVTQTPAPQTQTAEVPAPDETAAGDGLSRGQRFRIVEQEALKQLGPGSALSSTLAKAFVFPTARDDAIFGIDVSHHTTDNCGCPIDWDRVGSQKVAFVYAKATEGVAYKDPTFDKHWSELAKRPKIHRGAYHFLRADVDIETQVKKFLDKMGKLQPGDLPPAMDLEWDTYRDLTRKWEPKDGKDYWSNLGPDEILARALKWLKLVEKETGRVPVVYTSRTWWVERNIDEKNLEVLKRYPIWISAMEDDDLRLEKPGVKGRWAGKWNWTLWQFTNMGDLSKAGIKNPQKSSDERTDVSIFPGSLGQFQQAMGLAATIEVANNNVPTTSNTNPGGAVPGGGAVTPSEPQKEPPKDTQVTDAPVTDGNTTKPAEPNQSNVIAMPGIGGGTVMPAEPQKEPPKDTQVTDAPVADGNTTKPPESNQSNVVAMPETGGGTVMPAEPQKEPPKDTQVTDAPITDGNTTKPPESNQSNVVAIPETGGGTVMPAEPQKEPPKDTQVTDAPITDGNTTKPAEPNQSNVVAIPETGGGTVMPAEPQKEPPQKIEVANIPGADKNTALNPGSGAGAANDTRGPNSPAEASGADSGNNSGTGNKASPAGALSEKPTIEIVLKNGRVLRVEQSIDPAVLMQLIALLEK